jgi:hypothetical protein
MYSAENFLKYARDVSSAQVSESTLNEVRDVSTAAEDNAVELARDFEAAQGILFHWLLKEYSNVIFNGLSYPAFIAEKGSSIIGIDFEIISDARSTAPVIHRKLDAGIDFLNFGNSREFVLLFVVGKNVDPQLVAGIIKIARGKMADRSAMRIVVGEIVEATFVPRYDISATRPEGIVRPLSRGEPDFGTGGGGGFF